MNLIATILSHLLFAYIVIGEPILGTLFYRSLRQRLSADHSARQRYYKIMLLWQSAWMVVIAIILIPLDKPLEAIGLRPLNRNGWILAAAVVLVMAIALALSSLARRVPLGRLQNPPAETIFTPQNAAERRWYVLVVVVSSICEEVLYLGFVWFYLNHLFPGLNALFLVAVTALLFGTSHTFQSSAAVLETSLAALAMALLFLYSGSLIVPILFRLLGQMRPLLQAETPNP